MKIKVGYYIASLLILFAGISSGAEFKKIRIQKAPSKQAVALFESVARTSKVLEDGTIIQVMKLMPDVTPRQLEKIGAAAGGWKWDVDEENLKQHGLRYVATVLVENIGGGNYTIQHLAVAVPVESTNSNYILVIPWDHDQMAGSWVEGLARPCGSREYPIGHGVTKPKEAFEMIQFKALDRAAFLESLKKGATYQGLLSSETRCPECKGSGRVRNKSPIGKSNKNDTFPCNKCAGTGIVPTNTPYAVSW